MDIKGALVAAFVDLIVGVAGFAHDTFKIEGISR